MSDSTITSLVDIRTARELDRILPKWSNYKIIKCGKIIEVYHYETPYLYNLGSIRTTNSQLEESDDGRVRADNIERARKKIKRLVNSNTFVYGYHPIFITYTFARNCTNIREANRLFEKHITDIRRRIVGRKVRYLAVPELQKRGAIHYHVVFFDLPFIDGIKTIFAESWGQGFIQIKAVKHVRNVGAYISKYFSKRWHDERVTGTKGYFSSSNLYQPELFRSIDILDSFGIMIPEYQQEFFSDKFGRINYTQFKLV